jgi:hypothetical protein
MLVLRTGLQGHGKTLNAIKEIDEAAKAQDRPVYYHNVTGLDPSKLSAHWYEFDDPLKWYELPIDSFIVIDEAQGNEDKPMFGVRDPRKPVPLHVSAFETMRKQGHEVHLITQDPRLIDVHARRLCNKHIHMWRIFGTSKLSRYELPRVYNEVEKFSSSKDADRQTITLDKKYFGVYSSAQAKHHFKFKPSRKAIIFAVASIFAIFMVVRAGSMFFVDRSGTDSASVDLPVSPGSSVADTVKSFMPSSSSASSSPASRLDYVEARIPRIANIPSSAPIYDDLAAPQSFPRLYCMSSTDPDVYAREFTRMSSAVVNGRPTVCQCYTQQATRFTTDFAFCSAAVLNGYFDPAIPDRVPSQQQQQHPAGYQAAPQPSLDPNATPGQQITVVAYEKGKFLW